MLMIPLSDDPDYIIAVDLDGVIYDMRFEWNSREKAWYMYMGLSGDDPVIKTKVVTGANLLKPFSYKEEIPDGILVMFDTVAKYGRVTRNDLGILNRFTLIYMSKDEVNAF